ncbi:MAG: hypothetical protein ABH808_02675 [Candidatus Kuenenbacteria bacterium]
MKESLEIKENLITIFFKKDLLLKIEMLKNIIKEKTQINEADLKLIKRNIITSLIETKEFDKLLELFNEEILENNDLENFIQEIDSDNLLIKMAYENKDQIKIKYLFKFIVDPKIFESIVETKGNSFSKLSDLEKKEIVNLAEKFSKILKSDPKIYEIGELEKGDNKFIVGIFLKEEKENFYIAWSNIKKYKNHGDIFNAFLEKYKINFLDEWKSGGLISLKEMGDKLKVTFWGDSRGYGFYSYRMLEKIKEKIFNILKEELQKKFDFKEIEFEIEESME